MSARDRAVIEPSKRLPDLMLPAASNQGAVPLRPRGRRSPLVLLVHDVDCAPCAAFVGALESEVESLRDWDASPRVVLSEHPHAGTDRQASGTFPVLVDAEQLISRAFSIRAPAVIVADQWGEVHLRHSAGEDHRFPSIEELLEWLRFLAIQCPECQAESL